MKNYEKTLDELSSEEIQSLKENGGFADYHNDTDEAHAFMFLLEKSVESLTIEHRYHPAAMLAYSFVANALREIDKSMIALHIERWLTKPRKLSDSKD